MNGVDRHLRENSDSPMTLPHAEQFDAASFYRRVIVNQQAISNISNDISTIGIIIPATM
jgi:hypothetical protein